MKKLLAFIAFFVLSMLMCMATAMAYIDPSAVTFIVQIVAGVVIAAGAALGFYWRRIKRALSKRKNKGEEEEEEDDEEEEDEDE
jgi:membrane protein implicated in regulation of membrane protease activity